MIEIIHQLDKFGWSSVIIIILLVIMLIPQMQEAWNKFIKAMGLVPKKNLKEKESKRKEQEINEMFLDLEKKIDTLEDRLFERQTAYHEQSIAIRNNLKEEQSSLKKSQQELKDSIETIIKTLDSYIKTDNKRTIATLRSSLWRMHRDFVAQDFITPDGLKTFTEMGKVYEQAGGDDIYHEKLKPEILNLQVRSLDDGEEPQ